MQKYLALALLIGLNGCALHQKSYVSEIEIKGVNYGLKTAKGAEGSFYVDDHPLMRLVMACKKVTVLGLSISVAVPLPVFGEEDGHASIGQAPFSLRIFNDTFPTTPVPPPQISLTIGNTIHLLRLTDDKEIYPPNHFYTSELRCSAIQAATMTITFSTDKVRVYKLQFNEGVQHHFNLTPGLAT
jgi:hypothetical protein